VVAGSAPSTSATLDFSKETLNENRLATLESGAPGRRREDGEA
jgi:hypothetical protein